MGDQLYLLDLVESGAELAPYFDQSIEIDSLIMKKIEKIFDGQDIPVELVARKLTELKAFDPVLAKSILYSMEFFTWSWVQPELLPVDGEDSNLKYPQDKLVQLAVRRSRRVQIYREAWSLLDKNHQAALLIHEAVFALLKPEENGKQSNQRVREIVGALFLKKLNPDRAALLLGWDLAQSRVFGRGVLDIASLKGWLRSDGSFRAYSNPFLELEVSAEGHTERLVLSVFPVSSQTARLQSQAESVCLNLSDQWKSKNGVPVKRNLAVWREFRVQGIEINFSSLPEMGSYLSFSTLREYESTDLGKTSREFKSGAIFESDCVKVVTDRGAELMSVATDFWNSLPQ